MDISLNKKNTTEASIKISLKEADYQQQVEEKVKEYSRKADIKGFRKGKVPSSLIKQMYGSSILVDEINKVLSSKLNDFIKDNKLKILGEPLPDEESAKKINWETQKDFDFVYDIGLVDDIKVDMAKTKITGYDIKVDKKTIDESLVNLKKQFGEMTNPEVSEDGDYLYGKLTNEAAGIELDLSLPTETMEAKERKKFVGLKKDDSVDFDLLKVYKDEKVASQLVNKTINELKAIKSSYTFTVANVNRNVPAELNQDLFDKVFGKDVVSSEEEFLKKVESTISENYQRESDNFLNSNIKDALLEKTKIELPDAFLKRWLIVSNKSELTVEQVENEYDQYADDLRWSLIGNQIAQDADLKVEHEEVMAKAKEMIIAQLSGSGLGNMLDNVDAFVENYLKSNEGENYMKLMNQLRSEKILGLIREKIAIDRKKIDVEKFEKLLSN